jgi:hypothetical protein
LCNYVLRQPRTVSAGLYLQHTPTIVQDGGAAQPPAGIEQLPAPPQPTEQPADPPPPQPGAQVYPSTGLEAHYR